MKITKIKLGYEGSTSIGHVRFDDGSYGSWQINRCTGEIGLHYTVQPGVDGAPYRYATHGNRLRLVTRVLLRWLATGILEPDDFLAPERFAA